MTMQLQHTQPCSRAANPNRSMAGRAGIALRQLTVSLQSPNASSQVGTWAWSYDTHDPWEPPYGPWS